MKTFMNAMAGVVAGGLVVISVVCVSIYVGVTNETIKQIDDKLKRIDSRTQQTKRFIENLERVEEETKG